MYTCMFMNTMDHTCKKLSPLYYEEATAPCIPQAVHIRTYTGTSTPDLEISISR